MALDGVQKEHTLLSDAVGIWLKLRNDIEEYLAEQDRDHSEQRVNMPTF